jgi:transcriptional regulator with XRE-family HTH domain
MIKLGQKIKKARKQKRITQEDLANAIGVSDKSISAYESDRINPPLQILEKIAEKTDESLSYFL